MIGQTISHYRILEELGGGGMGVVYRAEGSAEARLWRMPAAGGDALPMTPPGSQDRRFSPDGATVYYGRSPDDESQISLYEMSTRGGPERLRAELSDRPGRFGGLKAADGEHLYFTWHQSFSDIWVMDVATNQ